MAKSKYQSIIRGPIMPKFNYEVIECHNESVIAGFVTRSAAEHLRNVLHEAYPNRRYALRPAK